MTWGFRTRELKETDTRVRVGQVHWFRHHGAALCGKAFADGDGWMPWPDARPPSASVVCRICERKVHELEL